MPGKRSRRRTRQKFNCPYCQTRLWRMGSPKHHLYYQEVSEVQKQLNIPRKKAGLLMAQHKTYLDRNTWIEDFVCEQHGKMWLKIHRSTDSSIKVSLATERDWRSSTGTIDPNRPNPSVSEFSRSMSRRPRLKVGRSQI